jgi:phage-related holin
MLAFITYLFTGFRSAFAWYHKSSVHQLLMDIGFGAVLTALAKLVEHYLFNDWRFAGWIGLLLVIDTITGFLVALVRGEVSSKAWGMIVRKLVAYGSVLIITHILTSFEVQGNKNTLFEWFTQIAYAALVVRESISILENVGKLAPGLIPAWILSRLKGFDKSGKPEDLTNQSNSETKTEPTE